MNGILLVVQSNKSRLVAENFDWIQTVDRLKIAERLNDRRPEHLPPLNVLIQINISDEVSKSGIQPEEMLLFAEKISQLPRLRLRGLMAIPKPESEPEQQKIALRKMEGFLTAYRSNLRALIRFQWECRTIWRVQLSVAQPWYALAQRFLGRGIITSNKCRLFVDKHSKTDILTTFLTQPMRTFQWLILIKF